jgi:hypothetical protein
MKAVNLILIIALLISTQVFAQKGEGKGKHKEMHKEMKAYKDANILPILKSQRLKLEGELTEAEKSTIAKVRTEMEAGKTANKDFHKEVRGVKKSDSELSEAQKEKMKAIRAERKQAMETLKPIAEAHKETLKSLKEEVAPKRETWEADLKSIRSKHISDEEWEKMQEERKAKREAHHAEKGHKEHKGKGKKHEGKGGFGMHKMARPTKFLLLDPTK